MVETENKVNGRLPRGPRKLSHFFTYEMLYDFMTGELDGDRIRGVQEQLKANETLKKDLEEMRTAEVYLEKLAQTRITQHHLIHLQNYQLPAEKALKRMRFGNWPHFARRLTEAILISVAAAGVGLYVPWSDVRGYFNGLVEASREMQMPFSKKLLDTRPDQQTDGLNLNLKVAEMIQKVTPSSEPKTVVQTDPFIEEAKKSSDVADAQNRESTTKSETTSVPKKTAGFVYSMMMSLDSTVELTPEITQKIIELGGVKAGQVELGWRKKNPDGSYFHFSMPEASYDALIKTLGGYGRVRIYKNPHDRIMPEGQIRIILWIEDNLIQQPQENEKQPEQTT